MPGRTSSGKGKVSLKKYASLSKSQNLLTRIRSFVPAPFTTMRISQLQHPRLQIDDFSISPGQCWCAYGTGRSGINEFLALLEGDLGEDFTDCLQTTEAPAIISFGIQQEIFEEEMRNDDSDFLDKPDIGTPARAFLPAQSLADPLIDLFDLRDSLEKGYRQLSSGQSRKLLILKALLEGSDNIILDSPYDGLDPMACQELDATFRQLPKEQLSLLVLVRNFEDIPDWCGHLALFAEGRLARQGGKEPLLSEAQALHRQSKALFENILYNGGDDAAQSLNQDQLELVRLKDGFASYGDYHVFSGLQLTLNRGEHTLVTGPNGCGKSTLLQIITGDNSKCYANELYMFGKRRGRGESIWEVKQHMGIVSPDIHRNYRVPGNALHVVLSGLFDSIGLYNKVNPAQEKEALAWLAAINMAEDATRPFRQLSYGEQRLVLIARGLIKRPPLLILDEPTQGLDSSSRRSLLDFLESISRGSLTTILYVSHRQDEYRGFFKQHLRLGGS